MGTSTACVGTTDFWCSASCRSQFWEDVQGQPRSLRPPPQQTSAFKYGRLPRSRSSLDFIFPTSIRSFMPARSRALARCLPAGSLRFIDPSPKFCRLRSTPDVYQIIRFPRSYLMELVLPQAEYPGCFGHLKQHPTLRDRQRGQRKRLSSKSALVLHSVAGVRRCSTVRRCMIFVCSYSVCPHQATLNRQFPGQVDSSTCNLSVVVAVRDVQYANES